MEGEKCQCWWVVSGCVSAKYVIEMNMIHRIYLGCWLSRSGAGSRVCVQKEGCCATGLVKCYRGGRGVEWPVGTEGSGRLRIVQE